MLSRHWIHWLSEKIIQKNTVSSFLEVYVLQTIVLKKENIKMFNQKKEDKFYKIVNI